MSATTDRATIARWTARLVIRRRLAASAKRAHTVAQTALRHARAADAHPRQDIIDARDAASLKLALRRTQVSAAERVIARAKARLANAGGATKVSDAGALLVARFEGFRSAPYQDSVGVWTIGYGETRGVTRNSPHVSEPVARAQLRRRLDNDYVPPVLAAAKAGGLRLRQNELDALASLSYNLGGGIFAAGYSMGNALRAGNRGRAADAILLYDKAGGRRLPGLTRRRQEERALFLRK